MERGSKPIARPTAAEGDQPGALYKAHRDTGESALNAASSPESVTLGSNPVPQIVSQEKVPGKLYTSVFPGPAREYHSSSRGKIRDFLKTRRQESAQESSPQSHGVFWDFLMGPPEEEPSSSVETHGRERPSVSYPGAAQHRYKLEPLNESPLKIFLKGFRREEKDRTIDKNFPEAIIQAETKNGRTETSGLGHTKRRVGAMNASYESSSGGGRVTRRFENVTEYTILYPSGQTVTYFVDRDTGTLITPTKDVPQPPDRSSISF